MTRNLIVLQNLIDSINFMNSHLPALIVDFDYFDIHRDELGKIVCTSGGYDPVHPGHLSVISESKKFGDTVVVIVNGDAFLSAKKDGRFKTYKPDVE